MEILEVLKQLREHIALETLYFIFAFLVFADTLTGVTKAWKNQRLKSRSLRDGLFCSVGELMFMVCCIVISNFIPLVGPIMFITFIWLNVKEFYSILENLIKIGVQPPPFLIKGLKVYKDLIGNINVPGAAEEEKKIE